MECLLGLACKDFVLIAADMTRAQSAFVMKDDEEKICQIGDNLLMGVCGENGDTTQFAEYIAKNIQLYKMRNGYSLSPNAAANFTRRNLADYLRSRTPYNVNLLMAGYDQKNDKFDLYFCDYLAALVKVPYAVHGYGGMLGLSVMDRYHTENLTIEQGYDVLKKCVKECHKRLIINLPNFKVRAITREGIKDLDDITASQLVLEESV